MRQCTMNGKYNTTILESLLEAKTDFIRYYYILQTKRNMTEQKQKEEKWYSNQSLWKMQIVHIK